MHAIFAYGCFALAGQQHTFRHGHVLLDGQARGAKAGSVSAIRHDHYVTAVELRMTDVDGREHVLYGAAVSQTHRPDSSNPHPAPVDR